MASSQLTLHILTPEGSILEVEDLLAISVPIPGSGTIGLRPGHAPLLAETSTGMVKFRSDSQEGEINLYPGVLNVRQNTVVILTAGEVTQKPGKLVFPYETNYLRLMQTLSKDMDQEQNIEDD